MFGNFNIILNRQTIEILKYSRQQTNLKNFLWHGRALQQQCQPIYLLSW